MLTLLACSKAAPVDVPAPAPAAAVRGAPLAGDPIKEPPPLELASLSPELSRSLGLSAPLPETGAAPASSVPGHLRPHVGTLRPADLPKDCAWLGFQDLSLPGYSPRAVLESEDSRPPIGFSPAVLAAQGKETLLLGFPLPYDQTRSGIQALLLLPGPPGCCFGALPGLDAEVVVELAVPAPLDLSPFEPRWVRGRFEAGEARDAYGFVSSVYRLLGARLEPVH